jgi:hypothetical protein
MPQTSLNKDIDLVFYTIQNRGVAIGYQKKLRKSLEYLNTLTKKLIPGAVVISYVESCHPYSSTSLILHKYLEFLASFCYPLNPYPCPVCFSYLKKPVYFFSFYLELLALILT